MKIYSHEYFLKKILDCSMEELNATIESKKSVCSEFKIPKQDGERTIVQVESNCSLERLQKKLLSSFLSMVPISVAAKGFVKGSSYVDFLEEHVGHEFFLRLDIKDFFGSISNQLLEDSLAPFLEEESKKDVIELCTIDSKVPQGFLVSPVISNIVFRRIDQRIRKYCRYYNKEMDRTIFYTRYADDMLFSSNGFDFKENKNFKGMILHILEENGFTCNERKTIYARNEISLSGYVISKDVHLSRKKLHNIHEIIYLFDARTKYDDTPFQLKKKRDLERLIRILNEKHLKKSNGEVIEFKGIENLIHYIAGWRSYLIQISRADHSKTDYGKQMGKKIMKLEKILDYLSGIEEKNGEKSKEKDEIEWQTQE